MIAVENERPAAEGIQRGRGGFLRSADGKPYVSDPTGAMTKHDGNKPELLALCAERGIVAPLKVTVAQLHELLGGRPKRLAYGSPSNRGLQIENSTNLVKWGERRVVLGIGLDPEIAAQCADLVGVDVDSDEYKTLADAIIVRAKEIAKANLAADRGTHVHVLTEDHDEARDWVRRAEAGEILGLDRELQASLIAGWHAMLEREGLEMLAVEASVVDDQWRLAGTLDRIMRTTRPLRFRKVTAEIVEIPAGTVVVGDVKTGGKRLDRNGCVQFWQAYAIQIASYAQSVPYDTEAETRGAWPFDIDQTHALIMHPDIDTAEWELIYCDLALGREHGGQCVIDARAWAERADVFSVAQLDTEIATGGPAPTPLNLALVEARNTLATAPEQGADLSGAEYTAGWDALQAHYTALDPAAKAWLAGLISEARRRAVSFHAREVRSLRTFELYRGLISLAEAGGDQDELLRALLALVIGDVALHAGIHPGHIAGSLGATEAARLAGLVDAFHADALVGAIGDDGVFVLREAAAA